MSRERKMKTVKAWALVDKGDGRPWCDATFRSKAKARAVRNGARDYRIARIEIREIKR